MYYVTACSILEYCATPHNYPPHGMVMCRRTQDMQWSNLAHGKYVAATNPTNISAVTPLPITLVRSSQL